MRVLVILCLIACSFQSVASLLVSPSRLAFDVRERTKEVILVNTSNQVRSYKLEWVNQRQTQDNAYAPLNEVESERFAIASPFLRFSPRRVTLQPGESQKIKVMARRRNSMDKSEYRSHLRFTALPPELTNASEDEDVQAGSMSMKLHLLLSYTIPVIMRTAAPSTDIAINNVTFSERGNDKQVVQVKISKKLGTSVYGDFTIFHELDGIEKPVAFLNGVNFFHEQQDMTLNIPVHHKIQNVAGRLKIVYKGSAEFADTIFDESSIVL